MSLPNESKEELLFVFLANPEYFYVDLVQMFRYDANPNLKYDAFPCRSGSATGTGYRGVGTVRCEGGEKLYLCC